MLKVFVEGRAREYENMFIKNGWCIAENVEDANLLQLIGGADVSPSLYGEAKHPRTHSSVLTDTATEALYQRALIKGIPITGICRGSQFLSVIGGGKVWQDVDGHATGHGHSIEDVETGEVIGECSSTHHQQHRPADNAIIYATAFPQLCEYKEGMDGKNVLHVDVETGKLNSTDMSIANDIEAFYYEHINSLGFQPHPEFFDVNHPCQKYYFELIKRSFNLHA